MNNTAMLINVMAMFCLVFSLIRDRRKTRQVVKAASSAFLMILPQALLIIVLIGFLMGFISPAIIARLLGQQSGVDGIGFAAVMGSILHIPSIFSFPLAAGLHSKGARVSNLIIFLTAWACIKLPQEMVELQFLDARFMLTRLGLTILAAMVMGLFIELIINSSKMHDKN